MKPAEVKRGSIRLRIYRGPTPSGRARYQFRWTDTQGLVHWRSAPSLKAAKTKAATVAAQLAGGAVETANLTREEFSACLRSLELCRRTGKPLELFVAQAVEAWLILNPAPLPLSAFPLPLATAASFYREHHPVDLPSVTVAEAVEDFLARTAPSLDVQHARMLTVQLNRLAAAFPGALSALTADRLDQWLRGLTNAVQKGEPVSRRTVLNYRHAIARLLTHARTRRWLPAGADPLAGVWQPKRGKSPANKVWQPEEMRALLAASQSISPCATAFLAITAFAGVRHDELSRDDGPRLTWEDVRLDMNTIHVRPEVSKTAEGRLVPLLPNCRAWLETCLHRGPIIPKHLTDRDLNNLLRRVSHRAQVPWKKNASRNSFVTYRRAAVQDDARVARECGHGAALASREYAGACVSPAEAAEWFGLVPVENFGTALARKA